MTIEIIFRCDDCDKEEFKGYFPIFYLSSIEEFESRIPLDTLWTENGPSHWTKNEFFYFCPKCSQKHADVKELGDTSSSSTIETMAKELLGKE